MKNRTAELKAERKLYIIDDKKVYLWDDFNFEEKEWIDKILDKLSGNDSSVKGNFTSDEIIKTLSIILKDEDGKDIDINIIKKIRDSQQVKILADFFLMRSMLGAIITQSLKN